MKIISLGNPARRLTGAGTVALLVAGWSAAAAAGELSVEGRIVDPRGNPLAQVPVLVQGQDQEGIAITNQAGEFAFFNLQPGDYLLAPVSAPDEALKVVIPAQGGWLARQQEAVDLGEITIGGAAR